MTDLNPEFRVFTTERPPLVNRLTGMHKIAQARILKPWRDATRAGLIDWRHVQYQRAKIGFYPVYPKLPIPDTDGLAKVYKVIVDTIVEVGMLPDDNPPHRSDDPHDPVVNRQAPYPLILVEVLPLEPVAGHGPGECDCRERYDRSKLNEAKTRAGL